MNYYDQSEEAWTQLFQQGSIDSVDLHNQLYKIERERANLRKQNKDCVEN
jgi:outer membrane protein TolC